VYKMDSPTLILTISSSVHFPVWIGSLSFPVAEYDSTSLPSSKVSKHDDWKNAVSSVVMLESLLSADALVPSWEDLDIMSLNEALGYSACCCSV
jgi:hypothetical protein